MRQSPPRSGAYASTSQRATGWWLTFYNRIGTHDYEGLAFDPGERARLFRDLGPHKALILRNHGLLTIGEDCAEAFSLMHALEIACQVQVDTLASGRPFTLPSPE